MRRTLLSLAVLLGIVFVGGYVARSWLDYRSDRTLLEFLFLVQVFLAWSHLSTESQIEHLRDEVRALRRDEPKAG
jgi:cobalamin biosynthesis protein CobD/CbiB